jgi:hypothetical protein
MERTKVKFTISSLPEGAFGRNPVCKRLLRTIRGNEPSPFKAEPELGNDQIIISISNQNLVCFLDCLLEVLVKLEAEQVFAGMDIVIKVIREKSPVLDKQTSLSPDCLQSVTDRFGQQSVKKGLQHYSRYYVMVYLGKHLTKGVGLCLERRETVLGVIHSVRLALDTTSKDGAFLDKRYAHLLQCPNAMSQSFETLKLSESSFYQPPSDPDSDRTHHQPFPNPFDLPTEFALKEDNPSQPILANPFDNPFSEPSLGLQAPIIIGIDRTPFEPEFKPMSNGPELQPTSTPFDEPLPDSEIYSQVQTIPEQLPNPFETNDEMREKAVSDVPLEAKRPANPFMKKEMASNEEPDNYIRIVQTEPTKEPEATTQESPIRKEDKKTPAKPKEQRKQQEDMDADDMKDLSEVISQLKPKEDQSRKMDIEYEAKEKEPEVVMHERVRYTRSPVEEEEYLKNVLENATELVKSTSSKNRGHKKWSNGFLDVIKERKEDVIQLFFSLPVIKVLEIVYGLHEEVLNEAMQCSNGKCKYKDTCSECRKYGAIPFQKPAACRAIIEIIEEQWDDKSKKYDLNKEFYSFTAFTDGFASASKGVQVYLSTPDGLKLLSKLLWDDEQGQALVAIARDISTNQKIKTYLIFQSLWLQKKLPISTFIAKFFEIREETFDFKAFLGTFTHFMNTDESSKTAEARRFILEVCSELKDPEFNKEATKWIGALIKREGKDDEMEQLKLKMATLSEAKATKELKKVFFNDILGLMLPTNVKKKKKGFFQKMMDLLSFSKEENDKEFGKELYKLFEDQWLKDFNQVIEDIFKVAQDNNYISLIIYLSKREKDMGAEQLLRNIISRFKAFLDDLKSSDLNILLLESLAKDVNKEDFLKVVFRFNYLVDNRQWPEGKEHKGKKASDVNWDKFQAMLTIQRKKDEVIGFFRMLHMNGTKMLGGLNREEAEELVKELVDEKVKVKCLDANLRKMQKLVYIQRLMRFLDDNCLEKIVTQEAGNKRLTLENFESKAELSFGKFCNRIKGLGETYDESLGDLVATVDDIETSLQDKENKYVKDCGLNYEDCLRIVENRKIFVILRSGDGLLKGLEDCSDYLKKQGKLKQEGQEKSAKITSKLRQTLESYKRHKMFNRKDWTSEKTRDEDDWLEVLSKNNEWIPMVRRVFPLIEQFKNKVARHFQDLLLDRDDEHQSVTDDHINNVKDLIDVFNSEAQFSSLLDFIKRLRQLPGLSSLVNLQEQLHKDIIEYSKGFHAEDNGVKKVETILTGSRLLFLFDETRLNLYALQTQDVGWNLKKNIAFLDKLKQPVEENKAGNNEQRVKGNFYTLQVMEDIRVKFSMDHSKMIPEALKKSFAGLMTAIDSLMANLTILKRKGLITNLKKMLDKHFAPIFVDDQDVPRAVEMASTMFEYNSSNFMIKITSENPKDPYNVDHVTVLSEVLENIVASVDQDQFERQSCNHWVHFLEGHQREMLTKCNQEDFQQEEALLTAMKAIPWSKQEYGFSNLKRIMSGTSESSESQLKDIKNNCMSLEKCSMKPTEIKNRKIFVVGNSEKDEKTRDYFRTLVTLKIDGNTIHPLQFYFGSSMKTTQEIEGFVKRALWDPEQRWYFFFDIHLLSTEMKNDLVRFCKKYSEDAALKNKNLILFTLKESLSNIYHDLAKNEQLFEILNLLSNAKIGGDDHTKQLFQSYTSKIHYQVVTSEFSGLGKTTYIQNASRRANRALRPFFLSGEVRQETIEKRIHLLNYVQERGQRYNLHIKLDMMDNMIVNADLVDQILFRICYLKMYPYQGGWYSFENVDYFYIEVGNSYKQEIIHNISFLRVRTDASAIYNIPEDFISDQTNWESSILESGQEMKATVVCKCWLALKHKLIGTMSLNTILYSEDSKLRCDDLQMKRILKEVFITQREGKLRTIEQGNFRQLNNLVMVLEEQLTQFDEVVALNPDTFALETDPAMVKFRANLEHTRLVSVRLIFELANELIWSTAAEVRNDSVTTLKQYNEMVKEGIRNVQVSKLPKWEQGNKLNVIFNEGCMKIVFKNAGQVTQEIKQVIKDQTGREFVDYTLMSVDSRERMLLREIFEALNLSQHLDQRYFSEEQMRALTTGNLPNLGDAKFQTLFHKLKRFNGKGYTLTIDNYLKILNIAQRAQLNIPIVIMGATGCGKTYMIDFIANFIFREQYLCFTLHSGVTEEDIEQYLIQAIDLAEESDRVWLLFDEFNTSPFQCLISEIMTERRCTFSNRQALQSIPENIIFVAACNPFRLKVNNSAVGLVHEASKLVLSHRVYPIPQSLIDYIWDFGQLTDEVETEYIRSMITNDKEFKKVKLSGEALERIARTIITCQNYLRSSETDSSVSLRDVQRYIDLFLYFHDILGNEDHGAMVMASYLCYFLRIDSKQQRKALQNKLHIALQAKIPFEEIFTQHSKEFINEIKSMKIIPSNISVNTPLIENLLSICVATMKNIPLIICGKPGTSKTVAINIAFDMFNASDEKKKCSRYLIKSPKCININFWGSITTTSQGIIQVFEDAKRQKAKHKQAKRAANEDLLLMELLPKPVESLVTVVFDEIGLAEIAESNPLKVLHSRLEDRNAKVGFIGLSNWKLDLSKMNRVIYVARPDMDSDDLFKTCQLDSSSSKTLREHLKGLSEAYAEFRKKECGEKDFHPNFHGSRDFYQMIRLIKEYSEITEGGRKREAELIQKLIESSIERNFSGKLVQNKRTSVELIGLYRKQMKLGGAEIVGSNSLDLIYQNLIDKEARHLMIFSEALEIEEMVVTEIKKFLRAAKKESEQERFVFLNNSRGKEDLQNIFYRLQVYAKEGYTLVMKNLDTIYPCLYDLLNQNYLASDEADGPKGCYLFNDHAKHKVTVHKDFKCILLMEREDSTLKNFDFEKKQQPPFLNRFEKHLVLYEDLIKDSEQLDSIQEQVDKLLGENKRINEIYQPCQLIHNLSKELIYSRGMSRSVVLKQMKMFSSNKNSLRAYYHRKFDVDSSSDNSMNEDGGEEENDPDEMEGEMKRRHDSLQSRNVILARYLDFVSKKMSESEFNKKTAKMKEQFLANHVYNDLESLLREVDTNKSKINRIVFTFSSPWVIKDILENLKNSSKPNGESLRNKISLVQANDVVAKGIVEREDIFKEIIKGKESILVVQFKEKGEWRYIQDFKYKLESLKQDKSLILVAHTSIEDVQNNLLVPTSINLITENWEMIVIDNLIGCYYGKFFERLESTLEDIRRPMLASQDSKDKAYCADIIFDAIKDYMVSIANNYEGLVRTSKFLTLIASNTEFEQFVLGKLGTQSKGMSSKKKLYQLIAEDKGTNMAARNFLDCEDFVKQRIRLEFSKNIKAILKDIDSKVGFQSILKTSIVSKEFQKAKIDDWMMMVEDTPFSASIPMGYKHRGQKELKLKKFNERIKNEVMKASDLVKQAKVAFKKIRPDESEMFETINKHDRVKNQILSALYSMVSTNVDLAIDPKLIEMHGESSFEDKLFAALQLCEPSIESDYVDQTLRILSEMIQTLNRRKDMHGLLSSLERLAMTGLVLLRIYKDDILFLATLLYRAEHKAAALIEKTLALFQEELTISCDLHDLLLFPNVANQDSVTELIESYKLYLDSWREETGESRSQEAAAKLMLKFFSSWLLVQDVNESNDIQAFVNRRVVNASTVQNMILEIIQLAGEKSRVKAMSGFLTQNLLEILEFIDFECEQIDEDRRLRAFQSIAAHVFEDRHPMDMQVMILANFIHENFLNGQQFNSMIHMPKLLDRFKNDATEAIKMKLKKYYFYFIDCKKSQEKIGTNDWMSRLLGIEVDLEATLRCKKDVHILKQKELETVWVFKALVEWFRSPQNKLKTSDLDKLDKIVSKLSQNAESRNLMLVLLKELMSKFKTAEGLQEAGLVNCGRVIREYSQDRTNNFVVAAEAEFMQMMAINKMLLSAQITNNLANFNFYERMEFLNLWAFSAHERQNLSRYLTEMPFVNQPLLQTFLQMPRENLSPNETFIIANCISLFENSPATKAILGDQALLVNYPPQALQRNLPIIQAQRTGGNANRQYTTIYECIRCGCPVWIGDCGQLNGAGKCAGCNVAIGGGSANLRALNMAQFNADTQRLLDANAVQYNPEGIEVTDFSWMLDIYPELTTMLSGRMVHLLQYIIFYARTLVRGQNAPQVSRAHAMAHIQKDIRQLVGLIERDEQSVFTIFCMGLEQLEKFLRGTNNQPPANFMTAIRTELNRIFAQYVTQLGDQLGRYEEAKRNKLNITRNVHQLYLDYIRGNISDANLRQNFDHRLRDVTMFLKEKKNTPIDAIHERLRELAGTEKLRPQYLLMLMEKEDLLIQFNEVVRGIRRFLKLVTSKFSGRFTREESTKRKLRWLIDEDEDEDLQQEFDKFKAIIERQLTPLTRNFESDFKFSLECNEDTTIGDRVRKLGDGNSPLCSYVYSDMTEELSPDEAVMRPLLERLADIQNKLVEEFRSLSIHFQNKANKLLPRCFFKCSGSSFIAHSKELHDRIRSRSFLQLSDNIDQGELLIDLEYLSSHLADHMFGQQVSVLSVQPFFFFKDSPSRNLKQLVVNVLPKLNKEPIESNREDREQQSSEDTQRGLKTISRMSKQDVERLEFILKLILPRVFEQGILTQNTKLEALLPIDEFHSFKEEQSTLKLFRMGDLETLRRKIECRKYDLLLPLLPGYSSDKPGKPMARVKPRDRQIEATIEELKVLFASACENDKLSKEKETRRVEDLSDLLEEEDFTMLGDIMHELDPSVPQGSETGKKLTVKQFPSVIKAIEEKYTVK